MYERSEFYIVYERSEFYIVIGAGIVEEIEVKAEYMGVLADRILRGRSLWRLMMYSRNT